MPSRTLPHARASCSPLPASNPACSGARMRRPRSEQRWQRRSSWESSRCTHAAAMPAAAGARAAAAAAAAAARPSHKNQHRPPCMSCWSAAPLLELTTCSRSLLQANLANAAVAATLGGKANKWAKWTNAAAAGVCLRHMPCHASLQVEARVKSRWGQPAVSHTLWLPATDPCCTSPCNKLCPGPSLPLQALRRRRWPRPRAAAAQRRAAAARGRRAARRAGQREQGPSLLEAARPRGRVAPRGLMPTARERCVGPGARGRGLDASAGRWLKSLLHAL